MKSKNLTVFWCVAFVSIALLLNGETVPRTKRILVMGDSWAAGMTHSLLGNVFQTALDDHNFKNVEVVATDQTTRTGWSAAFWASDRAGSLSSVRKALESQPSIDIVFLTTGGADFLQAAMRTNLAKLSDQERIRRWEDIARNTETTINKLLSVRPTIRVVLCDYDYMNLAKATKSVLKTDFHGISQADFNRFFVELGRYKRTIIEKTPRCYYVQNWGVLQNHFGDEENGYKAKTVPLPGGTPRFDPYPGGDVAKPGPAAAFNNLIINDGIHPNAQGYRVIVDNALKQVIESLLASISPESAQQSRNSRETK